LATVTAAVPPSAGRRKRHRRVHGHARHHQTRRRLAVTPSQPSRRRTRPHSPSEDRKIAQNSPSNRRDPLSRFPAPFRRIAAGHPYHSMPLLKTSISPRSIVVFIGVFEWAQTLAAATLSRESAAVRTKLDRGPPPLFAAPQCESNGTSHTHFLQDLKQIEEFNPSPISLFSRRRSSAVCHPFDEIPPPV
ncbi:hypothetical protein Salat_1369000, partial [Sesamum alatum]